MMNEIAKMWDGNLERISVAKNCIILNMCSAAPTHATPYRADPKHRHLENEEIEQTLKDGVTELATTKRVSPIVFVKKKNEIFWFCIEYRCLKTVAGRDTYPISCINACIDFLDEARIFSTLDDNSGYWKNTYMTAFFTQHGL